jgi:phosphoribosyl 1,2-cyclic phosphate phosphodiesterase
MPTKITILGCGGSGGVPFAGGVWGVCDPTNPYNRRTRSSVLISEGNTQLIIDTGADFHAQINRVGFMGQLNAVLYTHSHADHVAGIDDLRAFCFANEKPVPVYGSAMTLQDLYRRDGHVFSNTDLGYPTIAQGIELKPHQTIGGIDVQAFELPHGDITSTGFRVGDFGYVSDASTLTPEGFDKLQNLELLMVGTTHHTTAGQHPTINDVLEWFEILKPKKALLTHLSAFLGYSKLSQSLPAHVLPAYDGQVIEW